MEKEQAVNIAVTCVMSSFLDNETKQKIIKVLRELEENSRGGGNESKRKKNHDPGQGR